jgi:hypothetical protein
MNCRVRAFDFQSALSGLAGGLAAALFVELPLILLGLFAMAAALLLKFDVSQQGDDRSSA